MSEFEIVNQELTILLVDDEPDNFEVISGILYNSGYRLGYASSGVSALERLQKSQPDVILLDVMMPELDGIEVCCRIKANPNWKHIPIVMVTALNAKEDLARCLEAGADDFLSKPVSAVELRARIGSMLRIKQQYDALKASLQLRSDMANMIVHDLRNPLTTILLSCEMLDRAKLPDQYQTRINRIKIAEQQLRSLTESLLLMAKLESGKMILNLEEIDLSRLVNTCISDMQAIAGQKMIQMIPDLPELERPIWADKLVMRRVLDNLLLNAIKFSPSKSQVTVQINYLDDLITQIRVIDMGVGIADELKQRVFEKYETGTLMEDIQQVGLGLAFCQMAIEVHGGRISVEDNQPQGSVILIEISSLPPGAKHPYFKGRQAP
ncbi:MAG: hybrid sensor histidine kinase/response regulator [Nostoc sp. DedVER02]|uniref:hybrid sensor histidine kinase/response regulator n=1 Tax=unclassified Nostoc TaxID=2593658 RepID=UPI002AD48317|nr:MULTISPECIES: hybrid sensor histidine kinase/response regulator [unclassified Nostoc]MDZ7986242.1 hybrid sensor histidine kinase/response regulator [Nostoc sp. DedVER02]MDZ8112557.1 hybrid sensor histidine kinase/response regulator [Nostoc sp. DedVER01b]